MKPQVPDQDICCLLQIYQLLVSQDVCILEII